MYFSTIFKKKKKDRGIHPPPPPDIQGPNQLPPVWRKLRPVPAQAGRRGVAQGTPRPGRPKSELGALLRHPRCPAGSGRPKTQAPSEGPGSRSPRGQGLRLQAVPRPGVAGAHLSLGTPAPPRQPSWCAWAPAPSPRTPASHQPATRQPFQIYAGPAESSNALTQALLIGYWVRLLGQLKESLRGPRVFLHEPRPLQPPPARAKRTAVVLETCSLERTWTKLNWDMIWNDF